MVANLADHAGKFTTGRKGQFRLGLVFLFDNQGIEKIQANCFDVDDHFTRFGRGWVDIGDFKLRVRPPVITNQRFQQ